MGSLAPSPFFLFDVKGTIGLNPIFQSMRALGVPGTGPLHKSLVGFFFFRGLSIAQALTFGYHHPPLPG